MRALGTVAAALVVLVGVVAFAKLSLDGQVEAVRGILAGRVVAIESDQSATRAEKKEGRRLVKAGKKLLKYDGETTKRSLTKAALAVKHITKAKSGQEDVIGCVDDLLDALEGIVSRARNEATGYAWPAKSCRHKFDKSIGRGDRLTSRAASKRETNPGKAATYLVAAAGWFWKASDRAEKCADPGEPQVFIYGTRLFNMLDQDLRVDDMAFVFTGRLGGKPLAHSGSAATEIPGSFPMWLGAGASRDIMPLVFAILAADPSLPKWQLGDVVNVQITLETSEGDFNVGF